MSLTFTFPISVSLRCDIVFVAVLVGDFVVDFAYDTLVVVDFGG